MNDLAAVCTLIYGTIHVLLNGNTFKYKLKNLFIYEQHSFLRYLFVCASP